MSEIAHTHSFGTPCHPRCRRWGMPEGHAYSGRGVEDDDFRPLAGPTLATVHRKWLDRGLPAATWPSRTTEAYR